MNQSTRTIILKLIFLAASVCYISGCVTSRADDTLLVLENCRKETVLFSYPANQIEQVIYHYTQSYDRGEITEFFTLTDAGFVPVKMIFDTDSYDYHGTRYPGSKVTCADDTYIVEIPEFPAYEKIDYRVGYTIEQQMTILTADGEYHLIFQQLGDPGDRISLRLQ